MNCAECRERVLEAEPLEIAVALSGSQEGVGPSVISAEGPSGASFREHVTGCPGCRTAAEWVMAAQEELVGDLSVLSPRRPLHVSVPEAALEAARLSRRARRGSWGIAAAAVAAGILAVRTMDLDVGGEPSTVQIVATAPAVATVLTPEVDASLDESVAVFETEDSDIVVFWFYQGRGQ